MRCTDDQTNCDPRGVCLDYPFEMSELWAYVADMEELYDAELDYETLAWRIGDIEGFEVRVMIDTSVDERLVDPAAQCRMVMGGCLAVQQVLPYPYQRALSGDRTFDEWKSLRFEKHYTGLCVELLGGTTSSVHGLPVPIAGCCDRPRRVRSTTSR